MRATEEISLARGFVAELKLDEGVRGPVPFRRGAEYDSDHSANYNAGRES